MQPDGQFPKVVLAVLGSSLHNSGTVSKKFPGMFCTIFPRCLFFTHFANVISNAPYLRLSERISISSTASELVISNRKRKMFTSNS